ncbi:protein phosphatase 1 regulatory subunit 3C-B-like [Chanos chanos]|uniref:Protein phosphatase 1 regulatory subunit n=1 Tax=Chanos chanos TaxID=29144 RepID=A0A6J2UPH8_CHACN|nr:protein phosphatase 1 regulatory subunit 3C-like [Chanos chanos]
MLPADMTVSLRFSGNQPLCHFLGVHPPKPLRPCIQRQVTEKAALSRLHSPASPILNRTTTKSAVKAEASSRSPKRVVFADSKGLSLTAVRLFSQQEECPQIKPLPGRWKLCVVKKDNEVASAQGPRFRLGFQQPSADFQTFRSRLQEALVLLESCTVAERTLRGTVRVRNVCYEKAVQVRVTFDSWATHRDVPCTYLNQHYGIPDTDVFEFDIALPVRLDAQKRIEFCVSYLPDGFSEPVWDNNYGQNYIISVRDRT